MDVVPAATLDRARLAALFTAGYEGYPFPVEVDEERLEAMIASAGFDLDRSVVALREGEPIGLAMLGVRGDRGWVGGMGVVPAARRSGAGLALMEALLVGARDAGLREVLLEVLEANEPAIGLYERLGFRPTRLLGVWSWDGEPPPSTAQEAEPGEARELIHRRRTEPEPWQRADEALERTAPTAAVRAGEAGATLLRVKHGRVGVLQLWAEDEPAARDVLSAARRLGTSLHFLNVPEDDPAAAALRGLGARLETRQHELSLSL